jgi:hypothetical protein
VFAKLGFEGLFQRVFNCVIAIILIICICSVRTKNKWGGSGIGQEISFFGQYLAYLITIKINTNGIQLKYLENILTV